MKTPVAGIKSVPGRIFGALKKSVNSMSFDRQIRKLLTQSNESIPTRDTLAGLRSAWGNESYSADLDYLEELMARAVVPKFSILECGSGLTTVLLGILAGRRGVEVWALEHDPEWHATVNQVLKKYSIENVHLCLTPLRNYGVFEWYDVPLHEMPSNFELVVCDGPPGKIAGGRYGMLPIVGDRLLPGSIILLDDAARPIESNTLSRWESEASVTKELRGEPGGIYAVVTLPS